MCNHGRRNHDEMRRRQREMGEVDLVPPELIEHRTEKARIEGQLGRMRSQLGDTAGAIDALLRGADLDAERRAWGPAAEKRQNAVRMLDHQTEVIRLGQQGSPRILTGEQLVEGFGGRAPKADVHRWHGGTSKKSVAYKRTQAALDGFQRSFSELRGAPLGDKAAHIAELETKLDEIIAGGLAYEAKHRFTKGDEKAVMADLIGQGQEGEGPAAGGPAPRLRRRARHAG